MKKMRWIPALLLLVALSAMLLTACGGGKDPSDNDCEHEWVLTSVTNEGNCQKEGTGIFTCSKCNASKTDTTGQKGDHTVEVVPGVPATCTEPGLSDGKKCSLCGTVTEAQTEIPKKEHTIASAFGNVIFSFKIMQEKT